MIYTICKALVLPPSNLFLMALAGLLLRRRWPRLGGTLVGCAALGLWLACTPFCAGFLVRTLETQSDWQFRPGDPPADAIVVLAADEDPFAPEFGGPTAGSLTLERLRYGAKLQRESGLPLATSGGALRPGHEPMAQIMKRILTEEFGVEARWCEGKSRTTWENAEESVKLLSPEGVERVVLVTHAWHMPRARAAFETAGLRVVPGATGFRARPRAQIGEVLPSPRALAETYRACHEWLGLLYYRVRATAGRVRDRRSRAKEGAASRWRNRPTDERATPHGLAEQPHKPVPGQPHGNQPQGTWRFPVARRFLDESHQRW